MPGPFPGMDPYLEDPAEWPGVHDSLIYLFWEAIMADLPAGYEAKIQDRCYIVDAQRDVVPDLTVYPSTRRHRGAVALIEADAAIIVRSDPIEIHENYIHIYRKRERTRVITAIELLSPTNKAENSEGQRLYLQKQRETLRTRTHLLEIDLLRYGEHTVSVPAEALREEGRWDYITCLNRSIGAAWEYEAWTRTLRQRQPRAAVPLDTGVPDVILDIQAALDRYYEAGRFQEIIDYTQEPVPPLREEDRAWADALLREKGFRT
jgi:hypothetical protein